MTEPIPFWEDWEFWRVIVTGLFALIGFFLAAWAKYGFDLRRDDRLRNHQEADRARDKAVLAMGLRAELISLQDHAIGRINQVDLMRTDTSPLDAASYATVDLLPTPVYPGFPR